MASNSYDKTRTRIGNGETDVKFTAVDVRVALVSAAYTADRVNDEFMSSVTSAVLARSGALTGKTQANMIYDADDVPFTAPTAGSPATQVVTYFHTGSDATARVFMRHDIASTTLDGTDRNLRWSNATNKMGKL